MAGAEFEIDDMFKSLNRVRQLAGQARGAQGRERAARTDKLLVALEDFFAKYSNPFDVDDDITGAVVAPSDDTYMLKKRLVTLKQSLNRTPSKDEKAVIRAQLNDVVKALHNA